MRVVYGRYGTANLVDQHASRCDAIAGARRRRRCAQAIASDIADGMGLIGMRVGGFGLERLRSTGAASSSALAMIVATMRSISASVMISGGLITIESRTARTISPRSMQRSRTNGPAVPAAPPKRRLVPFSATISTAPDQPERARLADQRMLREFGQTAARDSGPVTSRGARRPAPRPR